MQIFKLDLNLLKVFDSVHRLRNLNEVGRHLNLSQSAVSHALARLRTSLDDKLFIRTVQGLEPTARADEIAPKIKQSLITIDEAIYGTQHFEPSTYEREFRLLLSDIGELTVLPRLVGHLKNIAPHVQLRVLPASSMQYDALLRERQADVAIGHLPRLNKNLKKRLLLRERYVVIARRQDDLLESSKLTMKQYCEASHVAVERIGTTPEIDAILLRAGASRNIVLRLPHYLAAPDVIAASDLWLTAPNFLAQALRKEGDRFVQYEIPFKGPDLEVKMYWHLRQDNDPAHRWFRKLIAGLFAPSDGITRIS